MGFSALFVSHDMAVIEEVADRVAVMREGRIVEEASRARLFEAPSHPYTRTLLAAVPRLTRDHEAHMAELAADT